MNPTRTRQQKTRTVLAALTTPVAIVAAGALVYQASMAAFTASTENNGNSWSSAAAITLTDNDSETALFDVTNYIPGEVKEHCIMVTANGGLDSSVQMYTRGVTGGDTALAAQINLKFERMDGTYADEAACLAAAASPAVVGPTPISTLTTSNNAWKTSPDAVTWAVGPQGAATSKWYRITSTFGPDNPTPAQQAALDATQGMNIKIDLVWERRTS